MKTKKIVSHQVSAGIKGFRIFLGMFPIALATFALIVGSGLAGPSMAPMKATPEFEKVASLVGEWQGKSPDGKIANVSYALVSDSSALMERLAIAGESEMVTMYYPDGDRLMMTHYCSAHNQPRMRSEKASGEIKKIAFDLVDVTNLSAPDAGHMKKLVLTFPDQDHFSQEWTWTEKGKDGTVVIQFERKK